MKNLTLTSFTALALLFAAATCNAQDRDRPQAMTAHTEGMHRGPDGHRAELDFPASVPGYGDQAALSSYQTIDGFWYYCSDPAGYFPDVPECPNGWRLVP